MADRELPGLAASAKVGGHPIHPMLVPFPIALLVATFVSDLVYLTNGNVFWADVSMWSLGAAIVTAALAALAGLTDFMGNARIRAINDSWKHMIGNIVVVLLSIASFWLRYDGGPFRQSGPGDSCCLSLQFSCFSTPAGKAENSSIIIASACIRKPKTAPRRHRP